LADIFVGFSATGDSGFLIGTGAFDVTTTSFIVDEDKVYCRPYGHTLRITMRANPALLTYYTFTSPFAGTIYAAADPNPRPNRAVFGFESTAKQALLGTGP
jgi:hypothetical protein